MAGLGKKALAAKILGSPLAKPFADGPGNSLRILAYHRVLDADPARFAYDEGVISATTEAFERQIRFLARNFDIISFKDLQAIEHGCQRPPKRPLIITFDDGYLDNCTNAFPILRQNKLPATIFLAGGYIGKDRLFWWDAIAYCVKHTVEESVVLAEISADTISLTSSTDRTDAIEMILRWIKQVPDTVKNEFVEDLPQRLKVDLRLRPEERMQLNWDEVRKMAAGGIEFGSHTMTHPILSNVASPALEGEIAGSKRLIEQELGREIIVFAYPVGGRRHFNGEVQAEVARSGFQYAVSYINGVTNIGQPVSMSPSGAGHSTQERLPNRFSMPRIHVEAADPMNMFRANLIFPKLMLSGPHIPF